MTMDTEGPMVPFVIPSSFQKKRNNAAWTKAQNKYGMPWKSSIATDGQCVYMPFWEWQCSYFQENLTNFKVLSTPLEHIANDKQRMVTLCGTSDEYRYIRLTYLDGGPQMQVFTSVCYPRGNHPILGIDLLQFGGKRHLAIADFQPIHQHESEHDVDYEYLLEPIRQAAPSLQEPMTDRFFDPSKHFSKQTLLGRFSSLDEIWEELWPSYQAYVKTHVQMTQQTSPSKPSALTSEQVQERHAAYDTYVAERDPAHPMFASMFGPEFAEDFLYQVLFPLAEKPDKKER